MIILQKEDQFSVFHNSHPLLIVQFGAQTCAPCGAIQDKIEYWRSRHAGTEFLYVPTDHFMNLCGQMGVHSVPTVWVYVQGKITLQESGIFSVDDLLSKVGRYHEMLQRARKAGN